MTSASLGSPLQSTNQNEPDQIGPNMHQNLKPND